MTIVSPSDLVLRLLNVQIWYQSVQDLAIFVRTWLQPDHLGGGPILSLNVARIRHIGGKRHDGFTYTRGAKDVVFGASAAKR